LTKIGQNTDTSSEYLREFMCLNFIVDTDRIQAETRESAADLNVRAKHVVDDGKRVTERTRCLRCSLDVKLNNVTGSLMLC
jgi:hypothetical protein